jgi:hypothetical protein
VNLVLPDGRKFVAEVDGGTGHSGRRSPDVHIGLGKLAADSKLNVELRWRNSGGQIQHSILILRPGWHTVLLGNPTTGQIAAAKVTSLP